MMADPVQKPSSPKWKRDPVAVVVEHFGITPACKCIAGTGYTTNIKKMVGDWFNATAPVGRILDTDDRQASPRHINRCGIDQIFVNEMPLSCVHQSSSAMCSPAHCAGHSSC